MFFLFVNCTAPLSSGKLTSLNCDTEWIHLRHHLLLQWGPLNQLLWRPCLLLVLQEDVGEGVAFGEELEAQACIVA